MTALVQQAFDSDAFGAPYYRVTAWDEPRLSEELGELVKRRPVIIDAKVRASEVDRVMTLERFGFRSVAMQVAMRHGLAPLPPPQHEVKIAARLALSADAIARHAANFRFDRFSCDPLLSRAGRDRVYRGWITNSLGGRAEAASHGADFCTFTCGGGILNIDLLSVLETRRGIGRSLVLAVLEEARRRGLKEARVVTECANEAAWRLYAGLGFLVESYLNCLHFVAA